MTKRAFCIGSALALLIAVGGHFNDAYMRQTYMVGNHFPVSVMGVLVLLAIVVNPILSRIGKRLRLRAAEFALIIALPFAVCVVPGSGFLRMFTQILAMPIHYEKSMPSWQENKVLSYIPPKLLPNGGADSEKVIGAYIEGKDAKEDRIGLTDVPWRAWRLPLLYWVPLFLLLMTGLTGLSLVLHRQWTSHEHLTYPVARFVQFITRGAENAATVSSRGAGTLAASGPTIVRNRLFWYGLVPILVIRIVNGLHAWRPTWIEIPHEIRVWPLRELFPTLAATPSSRYLWQSTIYFSVVAFAFFLPSDISLSLGLATILSVLFCAGLAVAGVVLGGSYLGTWEYSAPGVGAYLALAVLIAYNGRAYYRRVAAAAVRPLRHDTQLEPSAVWGMRVFAVMMLLCVLLMIRMGLAWPLAVLLTLLLVVTFTVMSRVCAETGLFFMQPNWYASGVLLGLFGAHAVGPEMLAVMTLITVIMSRNPREAMMPFVVNALRIAEDAGVRKGRVAWIMGGTLLVGLTLGLCTVFWLQYDRGVSFLDGYAVDWVPKSTCFLLDSHIESLKADGTLESALARSSWGRLSAMRPDGKYAGLILTGFLAFGICAFLRRRFPKWPLHPVVFLVAFTAPGKVFATSFLIGWLIKVLVVRFGGGRVYHRTLPLMVGVIAGDLVGALIFMLFGAGYYFATGFTPVQYWVFPP